MKQKLKYLFTATTCLLVIPFTVKADCDYQREAELSRIAANVQFSYNYVVNDYYPDFSITATNMTSDIYVVDNYGQAYYQTPEFSGEYRDGETVTFTIYSNDNNCRGEELLTRYVTLPEYNPRVNTDDCKQNPSFSLCQMWTDTSFTPEEFTTRLNQYKAQNQATEVAEEDETSILDVLTQFLLDNSIGLTVMLIVIIVIIILKIHYNKKYRR